MRRIAALIVVALSLAGCGGGPSTPLTHAIAALRAGDREDFLKAKAESDDAMKTSWQEGMDPCKVTIVDFQKHGEASLIEKLDHPELFKLSEEARFVYTAKIVGQLDAAMKELAGKPIMAVFAPPSFSSATSAPVCSPLAMMAGSDPLAEAPPGELGRRAILKDWMDALIDRGGSANGFADLMHNAVAELDKNGFSASWPETVEFVDNPDIKTFGQVQAEIDGKTGAH
jgi:hypothetical protein